MIRSTLALLLAVTVTKVPTHERPHRVLRAVITGTVSGIDVAPNHRWVEFNRPKNAIVGRKLFTSLRAPIDKLITQPSFRATRIIENPQVVLIEGIISGARDGKTVAAPMFYLAHVRQNEVKRSTIYWGTDILAATGLQSPPQPARAAEIVTSRPTSRLGQKEFGKLYRFAVFGLSARLAGENNTTLSQLALREVTDADVTKEASTAAEYLKTLGDLKVTLKNVYQAGSYTIANFTAAGAYGAARRHVTVPLLVVAKLPSGKRASAQIYADMTDLQAATP